jgi:hypothetical protein
VIILLRKKKKAVKPDESQDSTPESVSNPPSKPLEEEGYPPQQGDGLPQPQPTPQEPSLTTDVTSKPGLVVKAVYGGDDFYNASTSPVVTDASQDIVVTLEESDGALVISVDPADRVVRLPSFQLAPDASSWTSQGELRPVTVTDTRPNAAGWAASGQVTEFTAPGGATFAANSLGWTPKVLAQSAGQGVVPGPTVAPGFPTGDGLSVSQSLAFAPGGAGRGTASLGADLSLKVGTSLQPGTYQATATFTVI